MLAYRYLQVDPTIDLVILESEDTLGGTWSASRIYPELSTQQPYGQYESSDLSCEPAKDDPPQPANYIPSKRVHEYLNKFAETWGVKERVRFGTTVRRCQQAPDGVQWEVYVQAKGQSGEECLVCDKLIIGTGLTSLPHIPDVPSQNFAPLRFHSRYLGENYSRLQSSEVQTVCVYGGGKSGYDAVTAAVRNGKHVHWIIQPSKDGRGIPAFTLSEILGRPIAETALTPMANALLPNILERNSWTHYFLHSGRS
jgi:dimethylaniline monooxygenase (N-oxide forming)